MPGNKDEKITEGLDGLRQRLEHYATLGAGFAKWRGVIAITAVAPTRNSIRANAHALARYAMLCQEAGIVPVVEPEVLADGDPGDHSIERCADVTGETLETVFKELRLAGVDLSRHAAQAQHGPAGHPLARSPQRSRTSPAAPSTCCARTCPAAVPGIAFLSGGQSDEEATAHLSAMNQIDGMPWPLTFSYGRALQTSALLTWNGDEKNVAAGAGRLHPPRPHEFAGRARPVEPELDRAA